jgi:hypothetical protein
MNGSLPVLAENIFQTTADSTLRESICKSIFVDIQNVVDYRYEAQKESDGLSWDVRKDFPCVVPPWEMTWCEWHLPKHKDILLGTHSFSITPPLGKYHGMDLGAGIIELIDASAWKILLIDGYVSVHGNPAAWVARRIIPIQRTGEIQYIAIPGEEPNPDKSLMPFCVNKPWAERALFSKSYIYNLPGADPVDKAGEFFDVVLLYPTFLAISFSHCRNVQIHDTHIPASLSHRRKERGKLPVVSVKTLVIDTLRKAANSHSTITGKSEISCALHICRGHFKDYRESGLFGRNKGLFWWDMHVRGKEERGIVVKDYAIAHA